MSEKTGLIAEEMMSIIERLMTGDLPKDVKKILSDAKKTLNKIKEGAK